MQFQLEISVRKVTKKIKGNKRKKKEGKLTPTVEKKGWDYWEWEVKRRRDGRKGKGRRERERERESRERRESLFPSIFTGAELLDWELELQGVS